MVNELEKSLEGFVQVKNPANKWNAIKNSDIHLYINDLLSLHLKRDWEPISVGSEEFKELASRIQDEEFREIRIINACEFPERFSGYNSSGIKDYSFIYVKLYRGSK